VSGATHSTRGIRITSKRVRVSHDAPLQPRKHAQPPDPSGSPFTHELEEDELEEEELEEDELEEDELVELDSVEPSAAAVAVVTGGGSSGIIHPAARRPSAADKATKPATTRIPRLKSRYRRNERLNSAMRTSGGEG